ncbi:MAG TPA: GIY-YIG nuclease family protein [Pyrinomonadaceae bacterium]|nr:GIY-YIG nuclease family protein [Pyrinomonadaceae bacterium]
MPLERSDIEFPLWRKKVDSTLFEHNATPIPNWAVQMWKLSQLYQHCNSKKDPTSKVTIRFEGGEYDGWITVGYKGEKKIAYYRLWFEGALSLRLKHTFLMSYMRSLEGALSQSSQSEIETRTPFWEFLDIEFDEVKREIRFVAYYKQEPSFPALFKRMIGSPALNRIADEIGQKGTDRIYKQSWKQRDELEVELGAQNAIYILLDTENKLIYVGEASNLVRRLLQPHNSIPHWNYFRYSVLPASLTQFRVPLERMVIRDFASILRNKKVVHDIAISDYALANDKIDP